LSTREVTQGNNRRYTIATRSWNLGRMSVYWV